jgi:Uma2 family endonuclease
MTAAEFDALPDDDGVRRELIDGELWEDRPVPVHNRFHARCMTRVARFLDEWLDTQPEPRGQVLTDDAGVTLPSDARVGIDLAYVSAGVMADQSDRPGSKVIGVPELAVEIISPGTVWERHEAKIDIHLTAGVKLVWELRPQRRSLTALRPGRPPELFTGDQVVTAPDVLPGFAVPAAALFG